MPSIRRQSSTGDHAADAPSSLRARCPWTSWGAVCSLVANGPVADPRQTTAQPRSTPRVPCTAIPRQPLERWLSASGPADCFDAAACSPSLAAGRTPWPLQLRSPSASRSLHQHRTAPDATDADSGPLAHGEAKLPQRCDGLKPCACTQRRGRTFPFACARRHGRT